MKPIVVDTSVLVDIFLETAARHPEAKQLGEYLVKNNIEIRIPMHAMFELGCVLRNKKETSPYKLQTAITEARPLRVLPVAIDEQFFKDYFDFCLPYLKAGDFIFLAMATKDRAILITEDDQMLKKHRKLVLRFFTFPSFWQSMYVRQERPNSDVMPTT